MKIFKLERGESCNNYSSDFPDWESSAYFINLDCVTLEERRNKLPNGYSIRFFILDPISVEVTEATFKRILAAMEFKSF